MRTQIITDLEMICGMRPAAPVLDLASSLTSVVLMIVTPLEILSAFSIRAAAKVSMISMGFVFPPGVKNNFVVVPQVVIVVIVVMNTITGADSCRAAGDNHR